MPTVPASARVVLLQATQENDISQDNRDQAKRDWLRRIPRLEVQSVPGAHLTLLDDEHSPALAQALSKILQGAISD
jgi:thioesterase domain-containing protein